MCCTPKGKTQKLGYPSAIKHTLLCLNVDIFKFEMTTKQLKKVYVLWMCAVQCLCLCYCKLQVLDSGLVNSEL